jgi:hypothetical protein
LTGEAALKAALGESRNRRPNDQIMESMPASQSVPENSENSGQPDAGRTSGRTRFPPLAELPAGIVIEKVPVIGTTWYERGPRYWVRRFWLFLVMALVVTLTSLLIIGFLAGIKSSSQTGFTVALIIEVVWSLAIVVFVLVRTAQRWDAPDPPTRPLSRKQRRFVSLGPVLGMLARTGFLLGQIVLVVGSLVFFGLYLAIVIFTLLPEYPPEHRARLRLEHDLARYRSAAAR